MTELHTGHHKRQISDGLDSSTVAKRKKYAEPELRSPNGLVHLPEEVLLLILDILLDSLVRCYALRDVLQHLKTLHSLCLTNRKLNRLATPYLSTFVNNRNRRTVPQALDAMILDSRKAESIKYISWALEVNRSPQAVGRRSLTAETVFLKKLGRLGIPELAGELRQCFYGSAPEDHLATALVLAPNLEYLEAADVNYESDSTENAIWRPTWLELLSLSALSSPPGLSQHFQHLRHLRLSMGELNFAQIGPLLRLPALRTLHLENGSHGGSVPGQLWDEEIGRRCSPIETLIFENCSVSSDIVTQILYAISHLRVLKLEFNSWSLSGAEDTDDPDAPQLSWAILSQALAAHKEHLERLYIIEQETNSWVMTDDERKLNVAEQDSLASLGDMHKLRYLDTGLRPFRSNPTGKLLQRASLHDTLPASLAHLVIEVEALEEPFQNGSLEMTLQELAADCKSRLPLLRDVVVWLPKQRQNLLALDFSPCKAAFESQDIDVRVLVYDQGKWQLHPSTVKEPSLLGSSSWGCQLQSTIRSPSFPDIRAPVVFHGPCGAYHDPYGWSIIDDFGKGRP